MANRGSHTASLSDDEEQSREAVQQTVTWSRAVMSQVDRLRAAQENAVKSNSSRRERGRHTVEDNWPFMEMRVEKHFLFIAARQLLRALASVDGDTRLPASLPAKDVTLLRNALEHWDDPQGRANVEMEARDLKSTLHSWSDDWTLLGGLITVEDLAAWASSVYAEFEVRA